MPNVPQRSLTVVPALPKRWGTVALTDLPDLRLGEVILDIEATVKQRPSAIRPTTGG